MTENQEMQMQFGGCSNEEIRSCIRYRIDRIREIKKFIRDQSIKYTYIKITMNFTKLRLKRELKYLITIRNERKKTHERIYK